MSEYLQYKRDKIPRFPISMDATVNSGTTSGVASSSRVK